MSTNEVHFSIQTGYKNVGQMMRNRTQIDIERRRQKYRQK